MRAYAAGTTPKRGEKLKDIPFDLGGIAVVDIAAVYDSMREDERRYEKWLEALVYKTANESLAAIARSGSLRRPRFRTSTGDSVMEVIGVPAHGLRKGCGSRGRVHKRFREVSNVKRQANKRVEETTVTPRNSRGRHLSLTAAYLTHSVSP